MDAPERAELLEACRANYRETFERMARAVTGGAIVHCGNLTIVRTGIPAGAFNTVFAFDPPDDVVEARERIEEVLVSRNTPWLLVTAASGSEALTPLVREFHLRRALVLPGMVRALAPGAPSPAPLGLDIRRVTGREEFRTFARTVARGFGAPPTLLDAWGDGPTDPARTAACYLGLVGGKPVCSSLRVSTGRVAGVYFVTTDPEHRHRGYGTAMTWRAAWDGTEDGCTMSCLQASELGRPVYETMGYTVVEEYHVWAPSPAAPRPPGPGQPIGPADVVV